MRQAKCDQTQSAHAGNSRTSQMKRRVVRRCSGIDEIMKIPPYRVTSICALHDAWSVPEHVILHRHAIPIITIAPVAWPHMHMRSSHLLFGLCSPCGVRTCLLQTLAKKANLTSAPRKIQIISHDLQVYFPLNQAFDSISAPFWQAWEPALLWSFPEYLSTPYLATGREFLERSSRVLHHALRTVPATSGPELGRECVLVALRACVTWVFAHMDFSLGFDLFLFLFWIGKERCGMMFSRGFFLFFFFFCNGEGRCDAVRCDVTDFLSFFLSPA